MKTTLELPDTLFKTLKISLASEGISMKEFVTQAIEMRLNAQTFSTEKPWMKAFGGLSHLQQENRKVGKLIAEEFGRVDARDWK